MKNSQSKENVHDEKIIESKIKIHSKLKIKQISINKKWFAHHKLHIMCALIIGLFISAGILAAVENTIDEEETSKPESAHRGFFNNGDLESYRDWSTLGLDGRSWETAYYISDLMEEGKFSISCTNRYVIFYNCNFQKLHLFHARHVKFVNCSVQERLSCAFCLEVEFISSNFNSSTIDIERSEDILLSQNTIGTSPLNIEWCDLVEIIFNRFSGLCSISTQYCGECMIYGNDISEIGFDGIFISNIGCELCLYSNENGLGNIFSFDALMNYNPTIDFGNFYQVSEANNLLLSENGIEYSHLFVYEGAIQLGNEWLEDCIFDFPYLAPEVGSLTYINSFSEIYPLFSFEIPQVDIDFTNPFFLESYDIEINGLELTESRWDNLNSVEYSLEIIMHSIFGDEIIYSENIIKDIDAPKFMIRNPNNTYYGVDVPTIFIEIDELTGVSAINYTLNKNIIDGCDFSIGLDNTIEISCEETKYEQIGDGIVEMNITLVDLVMLNTTKNYTFTKDSTIPVIEVEIEETVYGYGLIPDYNATIIDDNAVYLDISLENAERMENVTLHGTLEALWEDVIHGRNSFSFIAYDIAGNSDSVQKIIDVDLLFENLTIITEQSQVYFSQISPCVYVDAQDPNFDYIQYIVDGSEPFTTNKQNGIVQIDETLWADLDDGEYSISFVSYDLLSNTKSCELNLTKDTISPN